MNKVGGKGNEREINISSDKSKEIHQHFITFLVMPLLEC